VPVGHFQYNEQCEGLERNISFAQERALEQAEVDSNGTWPGEQEHDGYSVNEAGMPIGGVSLILLLLFFNIFSFFNASFFRIIPNYFKKPDCSQLRGCSFISCREM